MPYGRKMQIIVILQKMQNYQMIIIVPRSSYISYKGVSTEY